MAIQKKIDVEIAIPEGVEVEIARGIVKIKGPKGEISKRLLAPAITTIKKDKSILVKCEPKKPTKREKTSIGTIKSHIRNMIKGVTQGFEYRLKICSGHFPMSVLIENKQVIVRNFLGEKIPRKTKISYGLVDVKVEGDVIIVSGTDKEKVGQTSANIEAITRRKGYDSRIFQDGIYLFQKDGKMIK